MKIKIMTSDAIEYIKKNIDKLVHYYVDGENPEIWLKKEMGTSAFVDVPDLEFDDFDDLEEAENDLIEEYDEPMEKVEIKGQPKTKTHSIATQK